MTSGRWPAEHFARSSKAALDLPEIALPGTLVRTPDRIEDRRVHAGPFTGVRMRNKAPSVFTRFFRQLGLSFL